MNVSASALVESMAAAWNAGDAERVLALAAQASDTETNDEGFLMLLGVAQQQAGDPARAAQTFERLTRIQPDVSAWWNNLGVAHRHAGNFEESERASSRAK